MKSQVKFWRATIKKIWKLIIPISAKLNFQSSNEMPMKLKNYYKKAPIVVFAPYSFLIFLHTQLHEPKISEKIIFEFFGNGVWVFSGEFLGPFLLIPPPPRKSELVSDWLNSTRAWVKTFAAYYFAYPLWCVCVGGGGVNRKDLNFNY